MNDDVHCPITVLDVQPPSVCEFIDLRVYNELLRSNNAPREEAGFQSYRSALQKHLLIVDDALRTAQEVVASLSSRRDRLTKSLEELNSILNPVRKLPTDVLRTICAYHVPTTSELMDAPMPEYGESPDEMMDTSDVCLYSSLVKRNMLWAASAVCREWNATIVASPELWRSISVHLRNPTSREGDHTSARLFSNINRLSLYMQRAGSHMVSLLCWTTDTYTPMNTYHPMLAVILSYASRFRHLHLQFPPNLLRLFSTTKMANLEWLHVHLPSMRFSNQGLPIRDVFDLSAYAPNLKRVEGDYSSLTAMTDANPRFVVPAGITYYEGLIITNADDLQTLRGLESLHTLILEGVNWDNDGEVAMGPILLPSLEKMHILLDMWGDRAVPPIFNIIRAANLKELIIEASTHIALTAISSSVSLGAVTTLHLTIGITAAVVEQNMRFLRHCPAVEHLTIVAEGGGFQEDPAGFMLVTVASSMFLDAYGPAKRNRLLPHLRSFTFDFPEEALGLMSDPTFGNIIVDMVAGRRQAGNVFNKITLPTAVGLDDDHVSVWNDLRRCGLVCEYASDEP